MTLTRRHFIGTAAMLPLATLLGPRTGAGEPLRRIQRSESPVNLETPLAALDRLQTPTELHYVRNHFPIPTMRPSDWRLRVVGAVERELNLTLDDLRGMTSRNVTMTLECAGNSRNSLNPAQRGVQWGHGAVSTTEWSGVSLIDVLNRAGGELTDTTAEATTVPPGPRAVKVYVVESLGETRRLPVF